MWRLNRDRRGRTEHGGVDLLEQRKRVVEREDLGRADKGEVSVLFSESEKHQRSPQEVYADMEEVRRFYSGSSADAYLAVGHV